MKSRIRELFEIVSTVLMSLAAVVMVWAALPLLTASRLGPDNGAAGPSAVAMERVDELITTESRALDAKGKPSLAIIEFSDFECPFCGKYARETYAKVKRELVDTGKVEYIFRHMPLTSIHRSALRASAAAECAREQGKFWDMHDRLFRFQTQLSDVDLVAHAAAVGLSPERYTDCRADPAATGRVRDDMNEAARLGVDSTPTFLIGDVTPDGRVSVYGRLKGYQPFESFKAAITDLRPSKM